MNKADLIEFEDDVAKLFNAGKIKAPVHLAGGNEDQLIEIFKKIRPQDWVCGGWRMHYHCLLKGVPPQKLKEAIIAGRSIALCFPEQRVISSAIVGGIMPIALGLARSAKRMRKDENVWCFVGDMTWDSGIADECMRYARNFGLPLSWVVEDNGLSVCTNTREVWGRNLSWSEDARRYCYDLTKPHVGTGQWVKF